MRDLLAASINTPSTHQHAREAMRLPVTVPLLFLSIYHSSTHHQLACNPAVSIYLVQGDCTSSLRRIYAAEALPRS